MTVIDLAQRREAREWERRRAEIEDLRDWFLMCDPPLFKRGSYRKSYKPRGQNTMLLRIALITAMGGIGGGGGFGHLCEAGMKIAGGRVYSGERKT